MLRKSLLSLIPLAATILINVAVAGILLHQLSGAARAQLSELPFQAGVRRLSDHAQRLTVQIQAAFVAGTATRLAAVKGISDNELAAFDRELAALNADTSGMLNRPVSTAPGAPTVRATLVELIALRDDLATTVERAEVFANEDLQRLEQITEEREALGVCRR